uniref:Riboflavin kinase n=1 Tax=Lepeophtheirus salmonis TaxID=72036 RepID=C1BSI3_LEPSM|nr:Riboflavin kinase [Lepeophtheirus salmonis]
MSSGLRGILHIPLSGKIIKGFGRGSKDLGIPTANFSEQVVETLPKDISTGIYFGWAQVDNKGPEKMVVSVGWNPFYKNEKKTIETHILKKYDSDLYGRLLKILIVGYIREERNYESLEALIEDIHADIAYAKDRLDNEPEMAALRLDPFFLEN